jgi:hypothetical protein
LEQYKEGRAKHLRLFDLLLKLVKLFGAEKFVKGHFKQSHFKTVDENAAKNVLY